MRWICFSAIIAASLVSNAFGSQGQLDGKEVIFLEEGAKKNEQFLQDMVVELGSISGRKIAAAGDYIFVIVDGRVTIWNEKEKFGGGNTLFTDLSRNLISLYDLDNPLILEFLDLLATRIREKKIARHIIDDFRPPIKVRLSNQERNVYGIKFAGENVYTYLFSHGGKTFRVKMKALNNNDPSDFFEQLVKYLNLKGVEKEEVEVDDIPASTPRYRFLFTGHALAVWRQGRNIEQILDITKVESVWELFLNGIAKKIDYSGKLPKISQPISKFSGLEGIAVKYDSDSFHTLYAAKKNVSAKTMRLTRLNDIKDEQQFLTALYNLPGDSVMEVSGPIGGQNTSFIYTDEEQTLYAWKPRENRIMRVGKVKKVELVWEKFLVDAARKLESSVATGNLISDPAELVQAHPLKGMSIKYHGDDFHTIYIADSSIGKLTIRTLKLTVKENLLREILNDNKFLRALYDCAPAANDVPVIEVSSLVDGYRFLYTGQRLEAWKLGMTDISTVGENVIKVAPVWDRFLNETARKMKAVSQDNVVGRTSQFLTEDPRIEGMGVMYSGDAFFTVYAQKLTAGPLRFTKMLKLNQFDEIIGDKQLLNQLFPLLYDLLKDNDDMEISRQFDGGICLLYTRPALWGWKPGVNKLKQVGDSVKKEVSPPVWEGFLKGTAQRNIEFAGETPTISQFMSLNDMQLEAICARYNPDENYTVYVNSRPPSPSTLNDVDLKRVGDEPNVDLFFVGAYLQRILRSPNLRPELYVDKHKFIYDRFEREFDVWNKGEHRFKKLGSKNEYDGMMHLKSKSRELYNDFIDNQVQKLLEPRTEILAISRYGYSIQYSNAKLRTRFMSDRKAHDAEQDLGQLIEKKIKPAMKNDNNKACQRSGNAKNCLKRMVECIVEEGNDDRFYHGPNIAISKQGNSKTASGEQPNEGKCFFLTDPRDYFRLTQK